MWGRESKKIIPNVKKGTIFKNFDFIFCDFIKHPNINSNKDITKRITISIKIDMKLMKRILYIIFSKLII